MNFKSSRFFKKADKIPSLVQGGVVYTIFSKFGVLKKVKDNNWLFLLTVTLLVTVPVVLLSIYEGNFVGDKVSVSFSRDISAIIRGFVVVPIFILVDPIIDKVFKVFLTRSKRLIEEYEIERFEGLLTRVGRLTSSAIPEVIIAIIVILYFLYQFKLSEFDVDTWAMYANGKGFTLAGKYFVFIGLPVYQFLFARWIWRYLIWVFVVSKLSKFNLKIFASHSDGMGGLEFVSIVPVSFGLIGFCLSMIVASMISELVVFQGKSLIEFIPLILVHVIAVTIITIGPLLFFSLKLLKAKAKGINQYGALLAEHHELFEKKWFREDKKEQILGNMDASSLADINGGYEVVSSMKVFPMSKERLIQFIVFITIPFLPLYFTMHSIKDILNKLTSYLLA